MTSQAARGGTVLPQIIYTDIASQHDFQIEE